MQERSAGRPSNIYTGLLQLTAESGNWSTDRIMHPHFMRKIIWKRSVLSLCFRT
jgi:hypothetical protein